MESRQAVSENMLPESQAIRSEAASAVSVGTGPTCRPTMDRHVCTAADPWTPEKSTRAEHPDAVHVDETDHGLGCYCVRYKCPHCGKSFEVELPQ